VLVLNGAVGDDTRDADRFATPFGVDALHSNAPPRHELVGLLAERLRGDDIYVRASTCDATRRCFPARL